MSRVQKCFNVGRYETLMDELRNRDDVSQIKVTNKSDYSGVEIEVSWIEKVK